MRHVMDSDQTPVRAFEPGQGVEGIRGCVSTEIGRASSVKHKAMFALMRHSAVNPSTISRKPKPIKRIYTYLRAREFGTF